MHIWNRTQTKQNQSCLRQKYFIEYFIYVLRISKEDNSLLHVIWENGHGNDVPLRFMSPFVSYVS